EHKTLLILEQALVYLELNNKKVIRVGLPESGEGINEYLSQIHHPALKHKLHSAIALKLLKKIIRECSCKHDIEICVNNKRLSEYRGHCNENLHALREIFGDKKITIKCDNRVDLNSVAINLDKENLHFLRQELLRELY
ncbi:MAG: hypothetical protein HQK84_02895, partial [Nitrospinae bacterium]|nr:hypothetical protein [Nitrospinota bacterium]